MRKFLIIHILFCLIFISCTKTDKKEVVVCGYAMNGANSEVVLYINDQPLDSTALDKDNKFCLRLDSLSDGLYNFRIGNEYQYLYLEKGDSIALSTNMFNFDESLAFSGRGSRINNFILSMFLKSEKDKSSIKNYYYLSPSDFIEKIDSLYDIRLKDLEEFKAKNKTLNQSVWELAEISATYDLLASKESYAQFYDNLRKEIVKDSLPENYYKHREQVPVNSKFAYHRSFFNYAQAHINNQAYHLCSQSKNHKNIKEKDHYHFHKLDLIDSIYGNNRILKDNLYRNAAYAYLFNVSDENTIEDYVKRAKLYSKDNQYKDELDSLFTVAQNLEKGKKLPNVQLQNTKSETINIQNLLHSRVNLLYFILPRDKEFSELVRNRVLQLKSLFSKVQYIGITIGGNYDDWMKEQSNSKLTQNYYGKDPKMISQKFLIYNPNRIIIVNNKGVIINAFGDIFSSDTEKILAEYLD